MNIVRLSDGGTVSADLLPVSCSGIRAPMVGMQGQFYATCAQYFYGGGGGSSSARYEQFAYDSISKKKLWGAIGENDTTFQALPGTTLYRTIGNVLEARNANDGTLRWTSPIRGSGPLLVTDNIVFVNDRTGIVAIDLASYQIIWSFPYSGSMSISSKGVLYIVGLNVGNLPEVVAINLR